MVLILWYLTNTFWTFLARRVIRHFMLPTFNHQILESYCHLAECIEAIFYTTYFVLITNFLNLNVIALMINNTKFIIRFNARFFQDGILNLFSGFRRRFIEQHCFRGPGAAELGHQLVVRDPSHLHLRTVAAGLRRLVLDPRLTHSTASHHDTRESRWTHFHKFR